MFEVTIVTGLYNIGKESWKTFQSSMHTYCVWLQYTINRVHGNVVVFTDPSMEARIREFTQNRRTMGNTTIVVVPFEQLPACAMFYNPLRELIGSDDFQARRPFAGIPEHTYPEYNVIMFNKVHFMKAAREVYPQSQYFVWLDAGLVRDPPSESIAWPDPKLLNPDKVALFALNGSYYILNKNDHVLSQTRFTQGGCIIVPNRLLDRLIHMLTDVIWESLDQKVIGSDEKNFDLCYLKDPDMFEVNVCNWREYFNFYRKASVRAHNTTSYCHSNLVLGVFGNYTVDNLRNWCESASRLSDKADLVLLKVDNKDDERVFQFCQERGIQVVHKPSIGKIHHARYQVAWEFLEKSKHPWDLVVWSDVNDVVFQEDPFPLVEEMLSRHGKNIIVGSEGLNIGDEPWNADNVNKTFPHIVSYVMKNDIICSGVMAGRLPYLRDLLFMIYNFSNNITSHDIIDQASLNVLMHSQMVRDNVYVTTTDEPLVVHCAVSGPTEFFKLWGFCNSYKYTLPSLDEARDTIVNSKTGVPYAIVHQYNRIPAWNEAMSRKSSDARRTTTITTTCLCVCATPGGLGMVAKFKKELFPNKDTYTLIDVTHAAEFDQSHALGTIVTFTHDRAREKIPCPDPSLPDKRHWWNSSGNRNMIWFYPYVRMMYFYKAHPNYDYYWFCDDDFWCTDWGEMMRGCDALDDDFMAYFVFKNSNATPAPNVPVFDERTYSKDWFGHNRFPGPGDHIPDEMKGHLLGSFFPVVRWSRRALDYMFSLMEQGYQAYGEGFVPTALYHAGLKVRTLLLPDNTSDIFDAKKCQLLHKNGVITWSWL